MQALKSSIEDNKRLINWAGLLVTALVTIQGVATAGQWIREQRRDAREEERDPIDRKATEQVANVMSLVRQTLNSRLDAEKEAREEAKEAQIELQRIARQEAEDARLDLQKVLARFESLERFYRNFQETIKISRQNLENRASELAQVSRHKFRSRTNELKSFAEKRDTFEAEYATLEEKPRPQFDARVPYIRGIAAHYANHPKRAVQCLREVVLLQQPESGETKDECNRRVANAYYYLGLTASNFGKPSEAILSFEKANTLYPLGTDFLTKVVTAEAYVMMGDLETATQIIVDIERQLRAKGQLRNFELRFQSRAILIKANMAILRRKVNWHEEVQQLLEPVHIADPQYYYATATLAQAYHEQGKIGKAQELFCEAYATIERLGHLLTVTEARSRILLLMVAGMCCKHGPEEERRSEQHLDEANHLRDNLPRMDHEACTVFSTPKQTERRKRDNPLPHRFYPRWKSSLVARKEIRGELAADLVKPIPGGLQPVTCGTSRARLTHRGQFAVIIGASCRAQKPRRPVEEVHIEHSEQPQQTLSAYHSFTRDFPCAIAAKGASRPETAGPAWGEN